MRLFRSILVAGCIIGISLSGSAQDMGTETIPVTSSSKSFLGTPKGNAVGILNAFIATFAKDNPAWKTEIVLISDPADVPPGKQLGYSAHLQTYYSFRPKFWEEMSEPAKQSVLTDTRLKSFLVSVRNKMIFPSITNTNTQIPTTKNVFPVEGIQPGKKPLVPAGAAVVEDPNTPVRIKVTPEEMLTDRALEIRVE